MATVNDGFGEALADALKQHKLTPTRAAAIVGTSYKHFHGVLVGTESPSMAAFVSWSEKLGITWRYEIEPLPE